MNEETKKQVREACSIVYKTIFDFVEVAMPMVWNFSNLLYGKYLESGAIYGETYEGFICWLNDIAEIQRHQQAIEEIKMRHWMIGDFKRMLVEKK